MTCWPATSATAASTPSTRPPAPSSARCRTHMAARSPSTACGAWPSATAAWPATPPRCSSRRASTTRQTACSAPSSPHSAKAGWQGPGHSAGSYQRAEGGPFMYTFRFKAVLAAVLTGAGLTAAPAASAIGAAGPGIAAASDSGWTSSVAFTNQVASSPATGGGYPVPPGQTFPNPGACRAGILDSNHSESWLAVRPGTEDLVGNSKFFFENFSKFYDFYLGSYRILNGTPSGDNQVQGYDCVSAGTQAMPPSWTNVTDPNAAFDTKGRVYQTTLPFNAF